MLNFDQLEIPEQVEFLNNQLSDNSNASLTKLLKKLGLNKSTIYKRFTIAGYKYSNSEELFKYKDILIKISRQ